MMTTACHVRTSSTVLRTAKTSFKNENLKNTQGHTLEERAHLFCRPDKTKLTKCVINLVYEIASFIHFARLFPERQFGACPRISSLSRPLSLSLSLFLSHTHTCSYLRPRPFVVRRLIMPPATLHQDRVGSTTSAAAATETTVQQQQLQETLTTLEYSKVRTLAVICGKGGWSECVCTLILRGITKNKENVPPMCEYDYIR